MQGGNSADLPPPPGTSPVKGEKEEKNLLAPRYLWFLLRACETSPIQPASPRLIVFFRTVFKRS
jgi:hypothetical protein